jgi:hypothetical protein
MDLTSTSLTAQLSKGYALDVSSDRHGASEHEKLIAASNLARRTSDKHRRSVR